MLPCFNFCRRGNIYKEGYEQASDITESAEVLEAAQRYVMVMDGINARKWAFL